MEKGGTGSGPLLAPGNNDTPATVPGGAEIVDLDLPEHTAAGEAPAVRLAHSILAEAIKRGASDIHLEPGPEGARVRYRIDGLLREATQVAPRLQASLVSRLKIMAQLDIAERRVPQDGRIQVRYGGRDVDVRVSTMPTLFGEKVVLRLLDAARLLRRVEQLGFGTENLARFRQLIAGRYGLVLITGPTGSGKTTTLYATLTEISAPELNVVTIEDPVEYVLPGITQIQVHPKAGLTFARGLRSILRQDPDIIMVGEIRDAETAEIAVRAAVTGHLVFSTLHTGDAAGALTRLIDTGVEPFLVASSVLGVVAQRLVRVICPACRESYSVPPGAAERYLLGVPDAGPLVLYRGRGCAACDHTGFRGRTAIAEVLPVTPPVRRLVADRAPAEAIREAALGDGMVPLARDGLDKARAGVTTVQEVMRVTGALV